MTKDVKLIAVDMDGTFLNSAMEYDREKFSFLYNKMKEENIHFVVASGNQYYQLKSFFGSIQDEITYIAENGAYIVDHGEELFCTEIPKDRLEKILSALDQYHDMEICVCGKKSAYVLTGKTNLYEICRHYYHKLAYTDSFLSVEDQIIKCALLVTKDKTVSRTEALVQQIGHLIKPVNSGHGSIDLIVPGCDKGAGIKLLCQKWNLTPDQCMAFGDSDNDLEMLRFVTHSYAMENARDIVKAAAKNKTLSNNENGVLKVLEELLAGH